MAVSFRLSPFSILLCLLTIAIVVAGGCQQPEQPAPEQKHIATAAAEPPDLTSLCKTTLKADMRAINAKRTALALEQINQNLKVCLPLATLQEQQDLLKLSTKMYQNFLQVDRNAAEQAAFKKYAFDLTPHPTIQQSHMEQLNLRDQYLLKHQTQAYVQVVDHGDQGFDYRRNPEYLATIFAPYMPDAEQIFIQQLAQQNTEPVIRDDTLMISPAEVAERALFWENYVKQYPQSSYIQDAIYLQKIYQIFLFKGLKKSPVSESYASETSVQPNSLDEIQKLTELSGSELGEQARKFMQFIDMDEQLKQKMIPLADANTQQPSEVLVQAQLTAWLKLRTSTLKQQRDCFSDSICITPQH